jgi:hypothetical protein
LGDRWAFYPNLYSFILAPPASSKSVMTFAKQLGAGLHKSLKEQSKTAFDKFKKDLIEYNRRKSRLLKSKKTSALFEAAEENEPIKPPVKLLFIPANTSAATCRTTSGSSSKNCHPNLEERMPSSWEMATV